MTPDPSSLRPATRLVHGGVQRTHHGETAEALFLTSGYVYDDAEQAEATFAGTVEHYQYSRFANPTLTMLEQRLCLIEGAEDCRTTATGMAAVNAAMLSHLKTGDRVVASRALFGSCHWIVSTLLPKFGIETEFVDGADIGQWRAALARPTNLVLLETPSNPMLELVDLPAVAELAHAAGAIVVVDNVFATPVAAATVEAWRRRRRLFLHQTYGRAGQGAWWRRFGHQEMDQRRAAALYPQHRAGACHPLTPGCLLKGIETLALRVDAACRSAAAIADFLAQHQAVTRVWYPMRADHPQQALAQQQMTAGGTVVTFEVAGGKEGAFQVMNGFGLIAVSNNLGDSKSLATHPATTTHMRIGEQERARLGITDGVIRVSIGLEDMDDIKDDLRQALDRLVPGQTVLAAE